MGLPPAHPHWSDFFHLVRNQDLRVAKGFRDLGWSLWGLELPLAGLINLSSLWRASIYEESLWEKRPPHKFLIGLQPYHDRDIQTVRNLGWFWVTFGSSKIFWIYETVFRNHSSDDFFHVLQTFFSSSRNIENRKYTAKPKKFIEDENTKSESCSGNLLTIT